MSLDLEEGAAGSKLADYARFLSMRWPLTFSVEASRYSVTLPEGARKLGIVPKEGSMVVFICGRIFEIWNLEEWNAHYKAQGLTVDKIREDLS